MSKASPQPAKPSVKDEATLLDVSEADSEHKTSTLERLNSDSWTWEILAIAFSLACSIALIVLLWQYDSAPVPQFRHGITLNAMISILATAAKGSFLLPVAEALSQYKWLRFRRAGRKLVEFDVFDSASRGPWGSLIMLGRINFRDVTSVGALITVLAIAFDPFMQQVVVYEPRSIQTADTFVNRTQLYRDPDLSTFPLTSLKSRAALYNGLFNGDLVKDFAPICSTGNCTWPPITSLAFCSACEELDPNVALSCKASKLTPNSGTKNCTFNSPNTFPQLNLSFHDAGNNITLVMSINVALLSDFYVETRYAPPNETIAGLRNPWAAFVRVMLNPDTNHHPLEIERVTTCALAPCLKTYNVSVYEGRTVSTVFDVWKFDRWTVSEDLLVHFPPPLAEMVKGSSNTTFTVDYWTALGLWMLLGQTFTGWFDQDPGFSSDVLQALHETSDLGPMMENVATSLSAHMRSVSLEQVQGTVWTMETYVHVRWIWLILPMGMMPASLLFLVSAIWRSWNVGVWKSSSLAVLFHGLENVSGKLERQSEMQEVAQGIVVRLQPTSDDTEKLVGPKVLKGEAPANPREDPASPRQDPPVVFQIPRRPVGSR